MLNNGVVLSFFWFGVILVCRICFWNEYIRVKKVVGCMGDILIFSVKGGEVKEEIGGRRRGYGGVER